MVQVWKNKFTKLGMIIGKYIFKLFPIDNKKIIFDNFEGRGYGCNPKYIAEELIRQKVDCKMIWLVRSIDEPIPDPIKKVKINSVRAIKERLTAKVWIDNIRNGKGVKKRKKQYYIQTWHGAYGVKRSEKEVIGILPRQYVKAAKYDSSITNLFLSTSKIQTQNYRENYWYYGEVLECGFPRDDLFYKHKNDEKIIKNIYDKLGIDRNKHIVLYAPTFRDDYRMTVFKMNYSATIKSLETTFGGEWIMISRMHPSITEQLCIECKDVIDVTDYPDMQELMLVSDILITDYSSSMFEYLLLDRPVFVYANDIDEIKDIGRLRDFFSDLPFPISKNNEELCDKIANFDHVIYKANVTLFEKEYGLYKNGNASKCVVDRIVRVLNGDGFNGSEDNT